MKQSLQSKKAAKTGRPAVSREFYTVADLAEMLQVQEITIRRMIRRGQIPVHKIGRAFRFRRSDVEDFLARCRVVEGTDQ